MDDITPFRPTIHTQSDLQDAWTRLMTPLGFGRRSVWWLLIAESGSPIPHLTEIEDADTPPAGEERDAFAGFLRDVVPVVGDSAGENPTRIAFLLSRPGSQQVLPLDQEWAAALHDVARRSGLVCEMVHLATDMGILPLPPDALGSGHLAAI
ncbi:MAG: hypothetical protein L0H93_17960 [Nocardioides sp.]|nr:hypothetical protein [Nocardioides sp.]